MRGPQSKMAQTDAYQPETTIFERTTAAKGRLPGPGWLWRDRSPCVTTVREAESRVIELTLSGGDGGTVVASPRTFSAI